MKRFFLSAIVLSLAITAMAQDANGQSALRSLVVEEGGTGPYKAIMTEVPGLEKGTFAAKATGKEGTSQQERPAISPSGELTLTPFEGGLRLACNGQTVVEIPVLGMGEKPAALTTPLTFARHFTEDYEMLAGKRHRCTNEAYEYTAELASDLLLRVRLYDDGLAFRYECSGLSNVLPPQEQTTFRIPDGTRRWMQRWSDGYEGFYPLTNTAHRERANGRTPRIGFPALLEPADGLFALITEANIQRRQSAASLFVDGDRYRVVPDKNEILLSGSWNTPWRLVITGSLADIVESTLVTDVAEPCRLQDVSWIKPGVVSWVYWAYNHGSNDYNIIKKYVDMAVALRLPYVLIDAEWDEMLNGKTIEDAVKYAVDNKVKPIIWYNSSVGWIDGAPTPKFRLNKPEDREKEFAWCEKIGVAGVKIDFFSGESQMNMDFCLDLLESASKHHLLVNFHGAAVPRGWQRTWPNLLSTEGVYGAEWYNNVPTFTKAAARHNATLPFTRNVIGPMDYTPCAFSDSQHPHITSNAHELALTVLYESGLQHLADKPESYFAQPQEVQQFFGQLPTIWDETRLVSGYPGESVVIARRHGDTWYVAGINGRDEAQTLKTDLSFIGETKSIQLYADEAGKPWVITNPASLPSEIMCQPRGGFVLVIK